ncbi:MAG TPA: 2OG-Fe(II) oxygenase, partial [Casimicrobiaceae bacterium]
MNARDKDALVMPAEVADRVASTDWSPIADELDARGNAIIEQLLTPVECGALTSLYPRDAPFRSRVVMERHGFGRGEYKYFNYPLPDIVTALRTAIYPHLASVANGWNDALG